MAPFKKVQFLPLYPTFVVGELVSITFKKNVEEHGATTGVRADVKAKTEAKGSGAATNDIKLTPSMQEGVEMGTVIFMAENFICNGLILGDRLTKVNGKTTPSDMEAEINSGKPCTVELVRRKGATPVTMKEFKELRYYPNHAIFNVPIEKPKDMKGTSPGLRLIIKPRACTITRVDKDTICMGYLGAGDIIYAIDGKPLPANGLEVEMFVREGLAKLSAGTRVYFTLMRPVGGRVSKDMHKWLSTLILDDVQTEMAQDAVDIGREASNMHSIVLRKLVTPSILTADVKKAKKGANTNKTSDASESNITISTASTEMKINSDVPEDEELKPVTSKSHAVSAQNMDVGAFDDE